jgi:transcriptional regulator with XRE-family HTH domain
VNSRLVNGSALLPGARIFGERLRAAMARRGLGKQRLARASGVPYSMIGNYRRGLNLPTTATATKLADALEDEGLVDVVVRARTRICPIDQRRFTCAGKAPRTYCSVECRRVAAKWRHGTPPQLSALWATERLATFVGAVDSMCRTCEPAGECRTLDCPLRAVSPLPFVPPPARGQQRRTSAAASAGG